MSTATLDGLDTAVILARRGVPKRTHAQVYAEIALTWAQMHPPSVHPENPMRTYVVAPSFAEQVWAHADTGRQVFAACARIVSTERWRLTEAKPTVRGERLTEALDPLCSWWLPLTSNNGLGVHYWQLALDIIELRSVGPVDEPPQLQYGRFAGRDDLR
jgi:hypothetical protein